MAKNKNMETTERVKQLLNSHDIEMKNLGLRIAKEILTEKDLKILIYRSILWPYRYIPEQEIIVQDVDMGYIDLWALHQKTDSPLLTLASDEDGIVIEEYKNTFKWTLPSCQEQKSS